MAKPPEAARGRSVRALRLVIATAYVGLTIAVTLLALAGPTLFTPAGIAAIFLAPLAIVATFVGGFAIGIPWMLGLTDAEPDDYSGSWAYALGIIMAVVNAICYIWLAARYQQQRRRRPA